MSLFQKSVLKKQLQALDESTALQADILCTDKGIDRLAYGLGEVIIIENA